MNTRILYTRLDGGVSIVIPSGEISLDAVIAKDIPYDATNIQIVDIGTIPTDRTFRDAWKQNGMYVEVDMIKARAIHLKKLRAIRDTKLTELDKEWMRAMGIKNNSLIDEIEAKRQRLRDMPVIIAPVLEAATTPEQLKLVTMAELQ